MKTDEKRIESQKRKWPSVQQTPYIPNQSELTNKKFIQNEHYDNNQMKFAYEQSMGQSNGDQKQAGEVIDMEMSENIAYVNILYDENMLTNIQEVLAPEPSYVSFETNWSNADILDLDQRSYYYEAHAVAEGGEMSAEKMDQMHPQGAHPMPDQAQACHGGQHYSMYAESHPSQMQAATPSNTVSSPDDCDDKNLSWLYNFKLNELPHLSPDINRGRTETGLQVDKLIEEVTSNLDDSPQQPVEPTQPENVPKSPKKPPFTYTELIEYALEDKGELTVSGIYNWISDRFPFYKSNDDRWKNSVRHNLSINPHFRKGNKAPQGAGHLWVISTRDSEANILAWEHKKQRLELFFKMEKSFAQAKESCAEESAPNLPKDETTAAVATLTSMMQGSSQTEFDSIDDNLEKSTFSSHAYSDSTEDLNRSAEEILSGVKRNVEVQAVNPPSALSFHEPSMLDYLNPVPKDQIVHESGLRSIRNTGEYTNEYFVTDLDPIELGINMNASNETEEVLFGDDFNLSYFGIIPENNIRA